MFYVLFTLIVCGKCSTVYVCVMLTYYPLPAASSFTSNALFHIEVLPTFSGCRNMIIFDKRAEYKLIQSGKVKSLGSVSFFFINAYKVCFAHQGYIKK